MIPMECPSCRRHGAIPPSQINSRLSCKKCGAIFHMDHNGNTFLGEPRGAGDDDRRRAAEKDRGRKKAARGPRSGGPRLDLRDLRGQWEELSERDRARVAGGAAAILGLVLLLTVGRGVFAGGSTNEKLLSRAKQVAAAFADDNAGRVQSLATSDSAEKAAEWVATGRKEAGLTGSSGDYTILTNLMTGGGSAPDASVSATFLPTTPPASASKKAGSAPALITQTLVFKRSGSDWLLDGQQTLIHHSLPY